MKSKHLTIPMLLLASSLCLTACKSKETVDPLESSPAVEESTEDRFAISDSLNTDLQATEPETRDPLETAVSVITETYANGTATGLLANGAGFTTMQKPGSLSSDNVPETEVQPTGSQKELAESIASSQSSNGSESIETDPTASTEDLSISETVMQKADVDAEQFVQNSELQLSEDEYILYDNVVLCWSTTPDLSEEYLYEMLSEGYLPNLTAEQRQSMIDEIKAVYPHNPEETVSYENYWQNKYGLTP